MPTIFISYRRSDSQDVTGRIYDRLVSKFSPKQVYKDVDTIPLGVSFPAHLRQLLSKANVVLVIIGPSWVSATDEDGGRRLDDPNDFVRLEIEQALRADMPVIPVLVSNAKMPKATELPASLRSLASRNGMEIGADPNFNRDIGRLFSGLDHLEKLLKGRLAKPAMPVGFIDAEPALDAPRPKAKVPQENSRTRKEPPERSPSERRELPQRKQSMLACGLLASAGVLCASVLVGSLYWYAEPTAEKKPDLKFTEKAGEERKSDVMVGLPESKKGSAKLDGAWIAESAIKNGKLDDNMKGEPLVFADGKVIGMGPTPVPYSAQLIESPHSIDVMVSPKLTLPGVFKIDGDKLHLSFAGKGLERPKDFGGKDGMVAVFRRATKDDLLYSRTLSANNLKYIGLAIHGYHDANKRLPSALTGGASDPAGKPLLSWRVALLPFLDEDALYKQFDLDQPWDHPTNKKLIAKMPKTFVVPNITAPAGMTHYRAFSGPDMPFEPGKRLTLIGVSDGTSNVIAVVEAKEPTIWTKPDDLEYTAKGPLPKFGVSSQGFNAMFLDAAVRFLPLPMPDDVIRPFFACTSGKIREWRIDDPDFIKNWKPALKKKD
jgi:hypothetical protein